MGSPTETLPAHNPYAARLLGHPPKTNPVECEHYRSLCAGQGLVCDDCGSTGTWNVRKHVYRWVFQDENGAWQWARQHDVELQRDTGAPGVSHGK